MSVLGKRIRTAREMLGLSQTGAAEKLGISNVVLNRYEQGERRPDPEMLKLIGDTFGVSIDYFLGRTDSPRANLNFWDRDTPPSDVELEDFLKSANIHFNGAPLNDEDKEDVLTYLKVKWEMEKKKKGDGEGS